MAGSYYALVAKEKWRYAFIAGICLGLAFIFRYQTLMFSGTLGVVFLFTHRFKMSIMLGAGFLLITTIVQGTADTLVWDIRLRRSSSMFTTIGYMVKSTRLDRGTTI
jgi:4-amino-4-deoxy-L-arabinose transferase-like glycosyltransferase